MKISMIAAMADQRVIGKDNQMPWHMPADLQHFKKVTLGKPVVMGRLTYESIGRPLPGRLNIVVSRNSELSIEGVTVVSSIEQAKAVAGDVDELMVIGGAKIYQQCLPTADRLYLTHIDLSVEGDAHFPDYQQYAWNELQSESHPADEKNSHAYRFVTLERA
ncbi:type 3 dihydrofolate reductase [Aliagarivorans marinus]|uniref:type 3 dihydrofolate reductase n=1 Tax=Aliagarivorans marinus TaxID=561965 RepID=UPI00047EB014